MSYVQGMESTSSQIMTAINQLGTNQKPLQSAVFSVDSSVRSLIGRNLRGVLKTVKVKDQEQGHLSVRDSFNNGHMLN